MPRKNRAVRKRNNSMRRRDAKPMFRLADTDRVIPDGRCNWQNPARPKVRFATEEKAQRALRAAQKRRAAVGSGYVEKRVYKCAEGGCGGWHLSAREEFDEDLARNRTDTYLRREGIIS